MKNDAALWQRGMEWGKELLAPPPRSHAEAYRHELKYLISYADKAELAVRMAPVLHLDPHAKQGGYFIRSLYFDDYWNTAYAEKDAGVLLRKKYRVRVYNCSDRSIKLERKKKFGSWIYKEAAPRPRGIVDYDREPWILDAGTVRVTFDMGVRAAVGSWDIFDPTLPTLPVLEPGKLVLEVKFTEFLPQLVRDLLPPRAQELTAVSKYVLCCDKTAYQHGFTYWNEP